jgi:hypothetical protein
MMKIPELDMRRMKMYSGLTLQTCFFLFAASTTYVMVAALTSGLFGARADELPKLIEIDEKSAFWVSELTPLPDQHLTTKAPIIARYQVSWSRVLKAGELELELSPPDAPDGELWRGRIAAQSTGVARGLWPYRGEARALVHKSTLLPYWFRRTQTERGVTKEYTGEYRRDLMSVQSVAWKKGNRIKSRTQDVFKSRHIRDIISTLLFLRAVDLSPGDNISVLVQPSDQLYLVSFHVVARERRRISGAKVGAVKLSLTIRRVRDDLSLARYSRMLQGTIWVEDNEERIPVEMLIELPVGFVSARRI